MKVVRNCEYRNSLEEFIKFVEYRIAEMNGTLGAHSKLWIHDSTMLEDLSDEDLDGLAAYLNTFAYDNGTQVYFKRSGDADVYLYINQTVGYTKPVKVLSIMDKTEIATRLMREPYNHIAAKLRIELSTEAQIRKAMGRKELLEDLARRFSTMLKEEFPEPAKERKHTKLMNSIRDLIRYARKTKRHT